MATVKTARKTSKKTPIKTRPAKKNTANSMKTYEKKDTSLDIISGKGIDFLDVKLTPLRKAFIIYYVTPGQPCFQNALQAAIKAGYSPSVARSEIYQLLRDPNIQKIIKLNESLAYQKLHAAAMKALEVKQIRAFFDPADFFEEREITEEAKDGTTYTRTINALKNIKNMTPEQRLCIDGMDIKGYASIPMYLMADRGKELNDLIKIDHDYSKSSGDEDGEEETMEIIMERLTIKRSVREMKDKISEIAGLKRIPQETGATEL